MLTDPDLAAIRAVIREELARLRVPDTSESPPEIARLVTCIFDIVGDVPFVVSDLLERATWNGRDYGRLRLVLEDIAPLAEPSAAKRIGQALLRASKVAEFDGLRVVRVGKKDNAGRWSITEIEIEGL